MFALDNGKKLEIIAGPCSVESRMQLFTTARQLKDIGIGVLRAGIWKPRSKYGQFEGTGEVGLSWLREVRQTLGIKTAVEVGTTKQLEIALRYEVDSVWIGARTTVCPFLVQELADALKGTNIPVMLKNPVCPDLALWRGAVDRFIHCGIKQLSLVHRGFCVPDASPFRNAPMLTWALSMRKIYPELPLICDPSHICGKRSLIESVADEALKSGFDGLMIESHYNPDTALTDAAQQLTPSELACLLNRLGIKYI